MKGKHTAGSALAKLILKWCDFSLDDFITKIS